MVDAAVVPAGPAVWLRMETDPSTTIVDSGGGHSVSCATGCPVLGAGKHGQGYVFTSSEVDVMPATDLQTGSGFTAALWFMIPSLPAAEACPWGKTFNPSNGWDTFALCIQTARAAGMRSIAVTWGFRPREKLAGADLLIDSPAALAALLK